ncbi:HpcH/HpaI aldolase family protein [Streptomyces cinereospinus]|uniref:HpcH/HpaI aldolase/citrate lyase family protein n=1 Tax=Streptomyces cinereospinus TaxID=285561 RepID=A0ABV5MZP4_9ACTN
MRALGTHGRPALGTFVKLPTPEAVEVLAVGGLDFVVLDTEHALIGPRDLSAMIAVARGNGIAPFVRVPGHAPRDVQPPLDAGAAGLVVPHVDDADQARSAVAACRFPPLGRRSVSNSGRAGGWGSTGLADYMERSDRDVLLIGQLESRRAVENAGSIAATAGLDAVMIGPADLAVSCGLALDDPELDRMVRSVEDVCRRAGHTLGITASDGAGAAARIARGHRFVVVSTDVALLARAAREVVTSGSAAG